MPTLSPKIYALLAVLAVIAALSWTTYHYHAKYESEVTDYTVLTAKNRELLADIDSDGVAIDKLSKDSQDRANAAKVALLASNKKYNDLVKQAQDMLLAQPINPADMCLSADALFNKYIGGK